MVYYKLKEPHYKVLTRLIPVEKRNWVELDRLKKDIQDWCTLNLKDYFEYLGEYSPHTLRGYCFVYIIKDPDDAILFKLIWG